MGFERPYDFEALGEDADVAIAAADKDVVGTGAYAMKIIALATSARGLESVGRRLTDIED